MPIILATFPLLAGLPQAEIFFNIVFFVVLTSVLIQGTSITLAARWLGVDAPLVRKTQSPLDYMPVGKSKSDLIEVPVPSDSPVLGRQIVELGLPPGVLVVLINRGEEFLVPRGNTVLEAGDVMLVLAEEQELGTFCDIVKTCPVR